MSTWEGFTEEDLQRIKGKTPAKKLVAGDNFQVVKREPAEKSASSTYRQDGATEKMPVEAVAVKPLSQVAPVQKQQPPPAVEPLKAPVEAAEVSPGKCLTSEPSIVQKKENKLSATVEPVVRERLNLDEFEQRRKAIEEQNRLKKETLSKVLNARKQKTTEEAKKLQLIQQELQRLDALLSSDVAILRQHIETASLGLSDAQKRYERAELEFIAAKRELFEKKEKKELLTEHLCTIIEQNEQRKANKLSELLKQLDDGTREEEVSSLPSGAVESAV